MKNIILLICLFVISNSLFAQRIPDKPTAVSSFNLTFDEQLQAAVGLVTPGKTVSVGDLSVSNYDKEKIDARWKELMDSSYELLIKRLKSEANLNILPLNTLEGKLRFLNRGYPIQNGFKKAAKVSDQEQFLNIQIQVLTSETSTTGTSENIGSIDGDNIDATSQNIAIKPLINVFLKFGGSDGKKFDKVKGTHKSKIKIHSEVTAIGSEDVSVSEQTTESMAFLDLLNKAIDKIIEQLK